MVGQRDRDTELGYSVHLIAIQDDSHPHPESKNRMREICSYGSVGESVGNHRLYPERDKKIEVVIGDIHLELTL